MAVDGDIEPVYEYQVGLLYRMWFPYEFASALQEGTVGAVAAAFALDNKARYAIWPSDPLPHLVESIYLATS